VGYKDPIQDLTTAFYDLIDGVTGIPTVYKEQVNPNESGNHVIIRAEGSTTTKNHSGFFTSVIIIVEIVTVYNTIINRSDVDEIDNIITELVFPTPNSFGINSTTNHQVHDIALQSTNYLPDYDGNKKYYSKINRYEFSINQN